jgi:hypothetical protein
VPAEYEGPVAEIGGTWKARLRRIEGDKARIGDDGGGRDGVVAKNGRRRDGKG